MLRSPASLVAALALGVGASLASAAPQVQVPFPLDALPGPPAVAGTLELQPDPGDLWALTELGDLVLTGMPLPDGSRLDLDLSRLEWDFSKMGVQVDGVPTPFDPLDLTLWQGSVVGEPGSEALLILASHGCYGWVRSQGEVTHLMPFVADGASWSESSARLVPETVLRAFGDPVVGEPCLADRVRDLTPQSPPDLLLPEGTYTLECKMAIETDYQLYNQFNDLQAAQTFVLSLLGAASGRYHAEINTVLTFPYVQFYTNPGDPWNAQGSGPGAQLTQFREAWEFNIPGGAHLAHFLSGVGGGGVAYLDVLCSPDWGFGVSFGIDGGTNFPISQGSGNWDFIVFTHEVGHNFGTPHTHDYCPPIDQCAPTNYWGQCQTATQCTNQGTLMSYCHLCGGGVNNITTYFHPQVKTVMRAEAEQSCLPNYLGGDPCNEDGFEPNDSCADPFALGTGSVVGLGVVDDDHDWYAIQVPSGEALYVDLAFVDSDGDVDARLWSDCGTLLATADSGSDDEHLVFSNGGLFSDVYYLEVFLFGGSGCNVYDLELALASDPCALVPDALEENDTCATARLQPADILSGLNVSKADPDLYTLCLAPGGTLQVDVYFEHATADVDLLLYEAGSCGGGVGQALAASASVSDDEVLSHTNTTGAAQELVWEVRVDGASPGECNTYVMVVSGPEGDCTPPPPVGTRYCTPAASNSTGQPGRLDATGSTAAADNDLVLTASQLPGAQFGYFLASLTQASVPNPGGSQGTLCLGGNIARFVAQIGNTGGTGSFQASIDLTAIPANPLTAAAPGETWSFQCWYRDANPTPTSNFTDGIAVAFD